MKILVLSYIPSPYQVELFNAVAEQTEFDFHVAYLYGKVDAGGENTAIASRWKPSPLRHSHWILNDDPQVSHKLETCLDSFHLVIFNYYQHPTALQLIHQRQASQKAWCFWGERPGFKQLGFIGAWYRRYRFAALHQSKAPIWGIGDWAVQQYQREFGMNRLYINLPYFSDLDRFHGNKGKVIDSTDRYFLYSGALIHRKGVDLLAHAFDALAQDYANVHLYLMGDGPLRPQLEQRLKRWGDRVQFLGFRSWGHLPEIYQRADILCVPSRYDGWAMVVPEGLASGLPVIGTTCTGAALELIQPQQNGWLIDGGNSVALYQAMRQAVALPNQDLVRMAEAAQRNMRLHSLRAGVIRFQDAINQSLLQFP